MILKARTPSLQRTRNAIAKHIRDLRNDYRIMEFRALTESERRQAIRANVRHYVRTLKASSKGAK